MVHRILSMREQGAPVNVGRMATLSGVPDRAQRRMLQRYLPIVGWLPRYERRWLVADALAGLSVWALLVPQSLAYATIVGVPVQYGLYTAFAALLVYPLFGTSRHLVVGPSATVGAVSAAVVTPLIGTGSLGTDEAARYAAALALATAVVYAALGLLRMGWISTFLSKAVMSGFILGFAIGIVINQSHSLLGVPGVDGSYIQQLWGTVEAIPDTSGVTLAIGAVSLGLLLVMRSRFPKLPRALIVVVLSIIAVEVFDLADHGVAITGDVPTGLFSIGLPGIGWSDSEALLIGALAVVFVGYSETLAAARSVARKHGYELDTNQELLAQGMANGAAGLVGGFVVDGSLSKTAVADDAGQKSELASLINAVFILATLLFLATLFESLPGATLGAVVIDAMVGLISLTALRRYYRVNRTDFVFFVGAGLGILFFGIMAGILIGVILSLLMLIARASRTNIRRLYRDPSSGAYHDVSRHEGLEPIPGLAIVRVDGPLFFADADRFRERLHELARAEKQPACLVVDASAVHLTDTDGADILIQIEEELRARGTTLALAGVHPPVLALWERAGLIEAVGERNVFDTIDDAVRGLLESRPEVELEQVKGARP
jgi:sulfate permease, SulP family